jgi:atypical dual specificity phosphatase
MSEDVISQILERVRNDADFKTLFLSDPATALAEYNLNSEQLEKLILPNFSWLVPGKLAGSSRPRSEEALGLLKKAGVTSILSLSEEPLSPGWLEKQGLSAQHLPVEDFTAPTLEQINSAVDFIKTGIGNGEIVAVHCGAGLGRTGTILASFLVSTGLSPQEAIETVRKQRPGSIETGEQEAVIAQYGAEITKA